MPIKPTVRRWLSSWAGHRLRGAGVSNAVAAGYPASQPAAPGASPRAEQVHRPAGTLGYRADIDGLRAIAILAVLCFHAEIAGFTGGFVGVDVFFVISGYLITSIIRDEMAGARFSLLGFYERRARRILPAFFAMMVGCFVLAALLLYPPQFVSFADSARAAALFISSFHFRYQDGYFDPVSEREPLLHTWSLSVEEIFYIVFPFLLIWLRRYAEGSVVRSLIGIAAVSLTASAIVLAQDPQSRSAFFLPYSRAWELLLGALLAYGLFPAATRGVREGLGVIGLVMIGLAVFGFSPETTFPGINALLPCVGAALLIQAGHDGGPVATRLLALSVLVRIGQISYPLYLWHWPLLVFARLRFGEPLPDWGVAGILALSFVLAILSTRFIERPFRRRNGPISRRQVLAFSVAGTLGAAAFAAFGVYSDGWPGRYAPEVRHALQARYDVDPRWKDCLHTRPDADGCLFGDVEQPPTLALWGDSHAAVYSGMLGEVAREQGQSVQVFTMPSCAPADGWALARQGWRERCLDFQALALQRIVESQSIHTVVIGARFTGYPITDPASGFEAALRDAIRRLHDAGKAVYVLYPVPELGQKVPLAVGRGIAVGAIDDELARPIDELRTHLAPATELLDRIVAEEPVRAIKPFRALCDEAQCYFYRDGVVLYHDEHHLSLSGARSLKQLFLPLFHAHRAAGIGAARHDRASAEVCGSTCPGERTMWIREHP